MGTAFTYTCKKCGYNASVSGGLDCGFHAVVDTYICTYCKSLVDVLVGECGKVYPREEANNLRQIQEMDEKFYSCPECGNDEFLIKWNSRSRLCPRCGSRLTKDKNDGVILWD